MRSGAKWGCAKSLSVALCALAFAVGCERSAAPTVGGETHWLRSCDRDAECGTELSCECGVCTVSCENAGQCTAFAANARCVSRADASFAAACESTAPEQLCAQGSASETFEVTGARYDEASGCFGPDAVAGTLSSDGPPLCDEALTHALSPEGECWLFSDSCLPDGFSAVGQGMGPVFVPCSGTFERCAGVIPGACPSGEVRSGGECLSCAEARERTASAIDELSQDPQLLSCEVDADCGLVSTDTLCNGTCGEIAALAEQDKFAAGVDEISRTYCSDANWNELCGFSSPDCEQAVFSCQENRCVFGARPTCVAQGGCESPLTCIAETCARNCTGDSDCGTGEGCATEQAELCALSNVALGGTGTGQCLTLCGADADCDGELRCWDGYCVGALPECKLACPEIADTCDEERCIPIESFAYDPGPECRTPSVLGCVPRRDGAGFTSDANCFRSPEGQVHVGVSGSARAQLMRHGYEPCTLEEEIEASSAGLCE